MKNMKNRQHFFTLIELMTVLVVILALAGTITLMAPVVTKLSNDAKTKALIQSVCIAMEQYKNFEGSGGFYPISRKPAKRGADDDEDANDVAITYRPFYLDKTDNNGDRTTMLQFFDEGELAGVKLYDGGTRRFYLVDAYGTPFAYRAPGRLNPETFDLISLGANRKAGDDDGKEGWETEHQTDADGKKDESLAKYLSFNDNAIPYLGQGDDLTN